MKRFTMIFCTWMLVALPVIAQAVTPITTRAAKGAPLTYTEMDQNFTHLRDAIDGYATTFGSSVSALQSGQSAGVIGFTTKALMDADLAHVANTMAIVTNDATATNNTYWIKLGASGAGSWQKSSLSTTVPLVNAGLYADFATAVAAQGSTSAILVVSASMSIAADMTIPSTCAVWVLPGGTLAPASGKVLTINGPFRAEFTTALGGAGSVVFGLGSVTEVFARWYGTDGAAIQKAITAASRYVKAVYISSGIWNITSPIQLPAGDANSDYWGITIRGAKPEGKYQYLVGSVSTILKATGSVASVITNRIPLGGGVIGGAAAAYYTTVKDLVIDGNSLATDGYINGYQDQVDNITVIQCTHAGILFGEYTNSTRISNTTSTLNAYGIYAAGDWQTISFVRNCQLRQNTVAGAYISAGIGLHWEHVLFESNTGYGLEIYKPVDATNLVGSFLFTNCYWENNTDYAIYITGASAQTPTYLTFNRPHVNSSTVKGINIVQATVVNINDPYFAGSPTSAGYFTVGATATTVNISGYEGTIGATGLLIDGAGAAKVARYLSSATTEPGWNILNGRLQSYIKRPLAITIATSRSLDLTELYGSSISNLGQPAANTTITLPAVQAEGAQFIVYIATARSNYFRIATTGAASIYINGIAGTKAWVQTVTPTIGAAIMFTAVTTDQYGWVATPLNGSWTAY